LPASWNVSPPENIRWKTPIPGLSHASPIVWGNSVFVVTAVSSRADETLRVGLYGDIEPVEDDAAHEWRVYRLDKDTGDIRWYRTAHQGVPRIRRHPKSTHANPTPATDGRYVVAFFGSEGLYTYDFEGNLVWKKDLGLLSSGFFRAPDALWGFASSPVIHEGVVYVQCDVLVNSFLAAFDLETGKEMWRTPRTDVPTWSTPTLHRYGERLFLLVNGFRHIGGYDAGTGEEIWRMQGGGDIPVPTPVVAHDLVFITNAHGGPSRIYAVRLDAKGDISLRGEEQSNDHVVWSQPRGGNYMQTPLVYGDYLYLCRDNGVLGCYRARTGELVYQERLGGGTSGFSASPVAGDGKLYLSSEEGDVYVVKAGPDYELVATNAFDEILMASPAISGGTLFFRTRGHVIAVEKPARPAQ
jgi:outer membrane protein assembly factor BamB